MNKLKKITLLISITLISLFSLLNVNVHASEIPKVLSEGAILIDADTSQILYSKNEHKKFEPASTTKIMTALIVLEHTKLTDTVTISEKPTLVDGSKLGIAKGEVYTVEELLYGLLLPSANDCAEALAEHISGSNLEFAKLMNAKAKDLGANDTTFKNPSGLHEDGHLTTAYDLALIIKEASKNKDFVRISQMSSYKYTNHPFSDGSEKWAVNINELFNEYSSYYYKYQYCAKNGYTPEANHTYASVAKKDGKTLIAAFLNAKDKVEFYTNVGPLFNYGFDNFENVKLINKGDKIAEYKIDNTTIIPLLVNDDIYYTKKIKDKTPSYSVSYDNKKLTTTKITKGDILFKGNVLVDKKVISPINLISGIDLDLSTITQTNSLPPSSKFDMITLINIGAFIIVLIILFILFKIIKNKKADKKSSM